MRDADQQFFDSFMLIVGILIGVAVGLFLLVSNFAIETQGEFVLSDPSVQAEIDKRIEPVGRVVLAGSAELSAAQTAAAAAPARVATTMTGEQVFHDVICSACHSPPGGPGAPLITDAAAWQDRIDQGIDTLYDHAINGYMGSGGYMPPKGGAVNLSDGEIRAAVDYMLEQLEP